MTTSKRGNDDDLDSKVKTVHELSTRIDERVKNLVGNQDKIEVKVEKFLEKQIEMISKILIAESKIEIIEDFLSEIEEKINTFDEHIHTLRLYKKSSESKYSFVYKYLADFILALCVGYMYWVLNWSK